MISMHFTPSASPDLNHSFVKISKEAVSTAESLDRVCFKLEKSRSMLQARKKPFNGNAYSRDDQNVRATHAMNFSRLVLS
jgi:hypothetical protein